MNTEKTIPVLMSGMNKDVAEIRVLLETAGTLSNKMPQAISAHVYSNRDLLERLEYGRLIGRTMARIKYKIENYSRMTKEQKVSGL